MRHNEGFFKKSSDIFALLGTISIKVGAGACTSAPAEHFPNHSWALSLGLKNALSSDCCEVLSRLPAQLVAKHLGGKNLSKHFYIFLPNTYLLLKQSGEVATNGKHERMPAVSVLTWLPPLPPPPVSL